MIRLNISRHVFQRARSGSIVAGVWLSSEESAFPADGWDDFVSPVLTAFVEAMIRLLTGGEEQTVRFMEGPFLVRLTLAGERLKLRGYEDGRQEVLRCDETIEFAVMAAMLMTAAKQVGDWCRNAGWWGVDEDALMARAGELKKLVTSRRGSG